MTSAFVVVVCEGFHDRAFVGGALQHLKLKGATASKDPKGRGWPPGAHAYAAGRLVVVPAKGADNLLRAARFWLNEPDGAVVPTHLLLIRDDDLPAGADDGPARQRLTALCDQLRRTPSTGPANLWRPAPNGAGGHTLVAAARWSAPMTPADTVGVPPMQDLDRLVCAALVRSGRGSGGPVRDFLADVQAKKAGKAHAWAHLARWAAELGCERFFEAVWEDEAIAAMLVEELEALGSWALLRDCADAARAAATPPTP